VRWIVRLSIGYNGLQLPVVGVLEHSTVYNHKCKFNEIMFICPLPRQLLVGAVSSSAFFVITLNNEIRCREFVFTTTE